MLPWLALLPGALWAWVLWFFRDPNRRPAGGEECLISPADGKIVEIVECEEPEFLQQPALKIAIFMNIFSVHVNRAPCAATVEWVRHCDGGFMNAFSPNASMENERMLIALRSENGAPILMKQVAGLIARRIVCVLQSGQKVARGERVGMIKFGSRVEIYAPRNSLAARVKLGQYVRAGETVLGEWT